MTVASRKTAQSCGPATLGFDEELFRLLRGYIRNVRTKFVLSELVPANSGALWLSLKGNKISNKRISNCLQKAWKLTGQIEPISTTILRKTAVTKTFEYDPTLMPLLGSHMNHSAAVQEKYYLLSKKRRNSANMTSAIRRATADRTRDWQENGRQSEESDTGETPVEINTERRMCLAESDGTTPGRGAVLSGLINSIK